MIPDRWLLLDYPWDLLAFVAIAALVRARTNRESPVSD